MVRRIGFGDGAGEKTEPVRRRGDPQTREPETAARSDPEDRRRSERQRQEATTAHRPAANAPRGASGPWVEEEHPPSAERRGRRLSLGKFIVLGLIWVVLINWALGAYGGLEAAQSTLEAAMNGRINPLLALFPAVLPLAVGLFVTQLILGRRRKRR